MKTSTRGIKHFARLYPVHLVTLIGVTVTQLWALPIVIIGALGAAAALYHLVERPGRRWILTLARQSS